MNDRRHLAAILGFAFVAAWVGFNLGYAVLCLLGAGSFYALAAVAAGNVDLGELQERFTGRSSSSGMSGAGTRAR